MTNSFLREIELFLSLLGFEFPAQDMDSLAPIHTPKRVCFYFTSLFTIMVALIGILYLLVRIKVQRQTA